MSLLAARNRHFSGSALRATLHQRDLRHQNAKETKPPVKRNRKSHHFSDLCSLSMQFRVKRKKTKERKKSMKKGISGDETRRRRGRPRKIRNPSDRVINKEKVVCSGEAYAYAADSERARPGSVDKDGLVKCKSEDKEEPVKRVDLSALGSFANGVERITVGLEELLGFLEHVNGELVDARKRKKACDSGGYLPRGWKLIVCIKNLWLACCRYLSPPDGQQFATCNEVVSTCQHSRVESQRLNSLQSDNKTLGGN